MCQFRQLTDVYDIQFRISDRLGKDHSCLVINRCFDGLFVMNIDKYGFDPKCLKIMKNIDGTSV